MEVKNSIDKKAIAQIIRNNNNAECTAGAYNIACELADYFAKDNEMFDYKKFMINCGLGE